MPWIKIPVCYIEDKNLDKKYIKFYKNEIQNNLRKTTTEKELSESISKSLEKYELIDDALDFLIKNKNNYIVEDNVLKFNNPSLIDEYNAIVENINE